MEVDDIDKEILSHHTESARKAFGGKLAFLVILKPDNVVIASIDADEDEIPYTEAAMLILKTSLKAVADLDPELGKMIGQLMGLENKNGD